MRMVNRYNLRPLLRARHEDGSFWLFVFHPDERWAMTRNGKEVSVGPGDPASIAAGIIQFLSLTRNTHRATAVSAAAVGPLLDRIELKRARFTEVLKPQESVRAGTSSSRSSARLIGSGAAAR